MRNKTFHLFLALTVLSALLLGACQPQTVIVEKQVPVTQIVTEVVKETVKETVVVEGTPKVVEKEVTKVVEKERVVTATPDPNQVTQGGTAIFSTFADAEVLNPVLSVDNASNHVIQMMFNAMVTMSPHDLTSVPDLAESWDVSEDGKSFTFHLHKGVTWHDGEPFTAEDVKFTYETILNDKVNSPKRADLASILTPEQIVVLDDYTVQFNLSQVDAAFLCCKANYYIIPKHILGDLEPEELNSAEFNTLAPVGTGPFMFREWVKDDHVALVKNPNYFKEEPNADFWYMKVVEDATVEFAQLQTGEVDYSENVTASLWEEALQQEHLNCETYPQFSFTFYIYNLDPEKTTLFQDVRTRRALLYAVDREALVESILFGLGTVAHSVIPGISWAHNPDNEPRYEYAPDKAAELLDEVGWRDENGDGIREAHGVEGVADGTKFSFELRTNAGNTEREGDIVAIQQYWAEIGVNARPTPIEWNALLAQLTETYDYEMILVGFGWDPDPDQKSMWHTDSYGGGYNMNKYSNERVDELLDAALQTVDQEERKTYYYEMQQILAEEVPAPILYFKEGTGCANQRLHDIYINDVLIEYNAEKWWLER
jgi:peptide/nickel transport system substrate-binding protein